MKSLKDAKSQDVEKMAVFKSHSNVAKICG